MADDHTLTRVSTISASFGIDDRGSKMTASKRYDSIPIDIARPASALLTERSMTPRVLPRLIASAILRLKLPKNSRRSAATTRSAGSPPPRP